MIHGRGHHPAELNFGELRYDWDDPRVAGFLDGLDLVYGIAAQCPGFVWRHSDGPDQADRNDLGDAMGGRPRMAWTLSVWEDAASLDHCVWNTVHRQFFDPRAEWYDAVGNSQLVMWWVTPGHLPTAAEGLARHNHLATHGQSDHAFGWTWLKKAGLVMV